MWISLRLPGLAQGSEPTNWPVTVMVKWEGTRLLRSLRVWPGQSPGCAALPHGRWNVGGLEIAVNDATDVGCMHRPRKLDKEA